MQNFEALRYQASKNASSSRILYDVACKVCQDNSSGKHYGIFACDGCAGFFKRSIRRNRQYVCKGKVEGTCMVDKTHRNQCRACRLRKCVKEGMNKDAVQHERGPRNSTLQRQMSLYFNENSDTPSESPGLDLSSSRLSTISGAADDSLDRQIALQNSIFLYQQPFMPQASIALPMTLTNPQFICESAASLLFMNIQWARNVPAFISLPANDQLVLLKESWHQLFILGAAQYLPPMELNSLMLSLVEIDKSREFQELAQEAAKFQDSITKFKQLQIDLHEYACMRATMLFRPVLEKEDSEKFLQEATTIKRLHEDSEQMLKCYVTTAYSVQSHRLGKLHQIMSAAKNVSSVVIEDIFFRRTIGPVPISTIICGMFKNPFFPS